LIKLRTRRPDDYFAPTSSRRIGQAAVKYLLIAANFTSPPSYSYALVTSALKITASAWLSICNMICRRYSRRERFYFTFFISLSSRAIKMLCQVATSMHLAKFERFAGSIFRPRLL